MGNWFEGTVSYEKTMEDGTQKKVSETYMADALSFTEAEARIIEEMTPFISGEFNITKLNRAKYAEVVTTTDQSADIFFKCRLSFITLDEKSGKEKKSNSVSIFQASGLEDALRRLKEYMKGTMVDYKIVEVKESNILDVFRYQK